MSGNAFERILSRLEQSDEAVTVKTASAPVAPSAETKMLETVRSVANAASKTAAVSTTPSAPVADLQRMAKEAQAAEDQQLLKEAHLMGAAVCDGFMERYAQYSAALEKEGVKVAAPSEDLIKRAAAEGYQKAVADMEKRAEADFKQGYEDMLRHVHKTAAEIHYAGQTMAHSIIEQLSK